MTLQQKLTKIATVLLWLLYCFNLSTAEIFLKAAARDLPNMGVFQNQNGSIASPSQPDAYLYMSENHYDHNDQYTETLGNDNNPDWRKVFKIAHGEYLWFKAWDSDDGADDGLGHAHVSVKDLHYLEIDECYKYKLVGDRDNGQFLLLKRVASDGDQPGEINCKNIITK